MGAPKIDVSGFDFALDADDVRHIRNGHDLENEPRADQESVAAGDYALLSQILNDAAANWVYAGTAKCTGHPLLSIVARIAGQAFTTRWEVLTKRRTLTLKTFLKGKKP